jgi:hypothetical protein
VKSFNELREPHGNPIPIVISGAGPPVEPRTIASPKATRLFSLVALGALAAGLVTASRGAYLAVTDAWVAPTQLGPQSREVVAFRMQAAKDREQRARFESELTSAAAEIVAIDLSLSRLRTLEDVYSKAIRWSTSDRDDQRGALLGQKALLERQRELTVEAIDREKTALERAKHNLAAGAITATELDAAQDALARTQLARSEKELEYIKVDAALEEASRAASALGAAARPPSAGRRGESHASPDVVRLDEVRINLELQIARLDAERRAVEARERAARESLKNMDDLEAELDSTPLFLAAQRDIDLAFVPYAHLKGVQAGDGVYTCRWFLFGCRDVGRIRRILPGEVVTDDPWGSVARGHYVELEMTDGAAMTERTLRVRRGGEARQSEPLVARRLDR